MKTKKRWYVGAVKGKVGLSGVFDVFQIEDVSEYELKKRTGFKYMYVIGAFRTKRGAELMAKYGHNNPHFQDVDDAERWAKLEREGRASFEFLGENYSQYEKKMEKIRVCPNCGKEFQAKDVSARYDKEIKKWFCGVRCEMNYAFRR